MEEGRTFGRYLDGAENWKTLFYATPGAPNSDSIPPVGMISGLEFENELSLYPNPARAIVQLVKSGNALEGKTAISIVDIQGKMQAVKINDFQDGKRWIIHTEELPAGVYFIRIRHDKGVASARFIKVGE
jgi:hypothetical protein